MHLYLLCLTFRLSSVSVIGVLVGVHVHIGRPVSGRLGIKGFLCNFLMPYPFNLS